MGITRELLSAGEVAAMLGVGTRTVHRMRAEGRLPPIVRIGRLVKWKRADIARFAADGCNVARSA